MKKLQIINMAFLGVLFVASVAVFAGVGFNELMGTINSIGKGYINDDGLFFGLPPLALSIISFVYLIMFIKSYVRKINNKKILFACWFNIAIPILLLVGFALALISGDGLAIAFLLPVFGVLSVILIIVSFILFIIGRNNMVNQY